VKAIKSKGPEQIDLGCLVQDRTNACPSVSSRPRLCTDLEHHPCVSQSSSHDEARPGSQYLANGVPRVGPAPPSVGSGKAELCRTCQAMEAGRWSACPDTGEILCWPLQTRSHGRCTPLHHWWVGTSSPKVARGMLHAGDAALPCPRCPGRMDGSPRHIRGWSPLPALVTFHFHVG